MPDAEYSDDERRAKHREHQRRYRERNREKVQERMRQWRAANPEKMRAYRKRWVDALPPEQRREYEARRRPAAIERAAAWNRENPDRRKAITRKFSQQDHIKARARARNYAKGELRDYVEILACDPCCYCGAPSKHIDHIEPLASGGANVPENLTAACVRCNVAKSAHPMLLFLLERR